MSTRKPPPLWAQSGHSKRQPIIKNHSELRTQKKHNAIILSQHTFGHLNQKPSSAQFRQIVAVPSPPAQTTIMSQTFISNDRRTQGGLRSKKRAPGLRPTKECNKNLNPSHSHAYLGSSRRVLRRRVCLHANHGPDKDFLAWSVRTR